MRTHPGRSLTVILATLFFLPSFEGKVQAQPSNQRGVGVRVQDQNGQSQDVQLYAGSYALIIGVSSYNNGWNRLPGVKTDMTAVRTALSQQGFTVEEVVDPTRRALRDGLEQFIDRYGLKPGNRLLIYFAGHGHTMKMDDGRELGYVVMKDAPLPSKDAEAFQQRTVSMDEIEVYARRITAKHALFVFDSCFSGKLVQRSGPRPSPYIDYVATSPVRQFITSGAADQTVPDQSVFRAMFIRGIEGEADFNHDGYVVGSELALYLQQQVTDYTNRSQTPQYGKIRDVSLDRGDFVFVISRRTPAAVTAAMIQEAYEALRRSNYDEVIRLADKVLAAEPQNGVAHRLLGSAYGNQGDNERRNSEAEAVLRLITTPTQAKEYEAKGWAYSNKQEYDRAIADYNKALELDPKYAAAYNSRGVAYNGKREYDRAIADYSKALELDPKYAFAYNNRGNSYRNKQEYDRAIADYSKAIELDFASAYNNRGLAYINKQEYDLALADCNKAIELNPKHVNAYRNRAKVWRAKGRNDLAEADEKMVKTLEEK